MEISKDDCHGLIPGSKNGIWRKIDMKKIENMLSILSYVFLVSIVVLLGLCSHYHIINDQRMVVICSGLILILFGIVFTLETKLKWLESEKRSIK